MAQLINVFIENRPGRLKSVTGILDEMQINIRAFTIQDRGDYGLMKLIVDKPKDAHLALADRGFACALREVLAISIPDKPGNLNKLTAIMTDHDVNIADVFGFVLEPSNMGVCCMEIRQPLTQDVVNALDEAGFKVLRETDLYEI